tara:strand:+ start:196 stop:516 length:321 start_codon:yes stop_codon:yes gene_type:complete
MTLLQFPTAIVKESKCRHELDQRIAEMEENYEILDRLHEGLHLMEQEVSLLEREYNNELKAYAKIVGNDQLEIKYLEYSTDATVAFAEDGSITVSYDIGEDDESKG